VKLVVGLGNPGSQYQLTRHNVGFRVLDKFVSENLNSGVDWKKRHFSFLIQSFLEGQRIIFAKPLTYMNLSGKAIKEIVNYYRVDKNDILVVYDDINLPLGRIRIRLKGSSGGHRGVESITQCLGSENFPRLRIGVGNEALLDYMDYSSFVLSKFSDEEEKIIEEMISNSSKAIKDIIILGFDYAMRKYNNSEKL